jgi:hypothetical protein
MPEPRYNPATMRITWINVGAVGRVLGIVYAFFGLANFLTYTFGNAPFLILPIGLLMGIIHLHINFHLARSASLLYNVFLCPASILAYAVSGWITGIVVALCFNFVAKNMGGIEAKFVSTLNDEAVRKFPA